MRDELEKKSVSELLDVSIELIRKYRILFNTILGSTPDENKEMHEILEGYTHREIRDALEWYKASHPK